MAAEVSPLLIITAWRERVRRARSACQASIIATNGLAANNIRRHRQLSAALRAPPANLDYLFVLILRPTKKLEGLCEKPTNFQLS